MPALLTRSIERFQALAPPARMIVILATAAVFGVGFVLSGFLLLLALFDRSIHGPAPPLLLLLLPLPAAVLLAAGAFLLACRLLRDSE